MSQGIVIQAALSLLLSAACGQTSRPASSQPASAPATAQAVDPEVRRILEALEKAGANIRADISYEVVLPRYGDTKTRTGWLAFMKGDEKSSAKFRITFLTLQQGTNPRIKEKLDYAFDGMWLTVARHRVKQILYQQLAAEGEKVEPFKLGKGPFPLPFGQPPDEMLKHFEISLRKPGKKDPENTDCLRLITRPGFEKEIPFERADMWVNRKTNLPVKFVARSRNRDRKTVLFSNIKLGEKLDKDLFTIPRPLGWKSKRERFAE